MEKIYGDRLHREEYVQKIVDVIKLCLENEKSISFSVEAEWGQGKTWLIEKVEATLKGIDISKAYSQEQFNKTHSHYFIVHYNAWEMDYYEEPLLALLLKIIDSLNERFYIQNTIKHLPKLIIPEVITALKNSLRLISKRILHFDIINVGENCVSKLKQIKESGKFKISAANNYSTIEDDIKQVVKSLNDLSREYPIVFVVDELDRCIPSFAIKTLERLHHIFSKVNCCVTILTFNRSQLLRSINHTYGNDTAEHYLGKFIDFKLLLNEGNIDLNETIMALKEFSSMFQNQTYDETILNQIKHIIEWLMPREFEHVIHRAILIHKLVSVDTRSFPIECMIAEILLQIKHSADELEGNTVNTSPNNGNSTNTRIGRLVKDSLKYYMRNGYAISIILNTVLNTQELKIEESNPNKKLLEDIKAYYLKYRIFYNAITHE